MYGVSNTSGLEFNGNIINYNTHGSNMVVAGRHKDGYPAYLVGPEFKDMRHKYETYFSNTGVVSASSEYSTTTHRATRPLNNQLVSLSNERWITTNGIKTGWWQYEFTDDNIPILCGLMWGMIDNDSTASPKKWQLLGWDATSSTWVKIFDRTEQPFRGYGKSDKNYCRMFWFTKNITPYKKIRINIDENHGGNYAGNIQCIRFYEHVVPGMDKYDTILYATEKQPFVCSVSCGLNENGTKIIDKVLTTTDHVTYDGRMLAENTTNYMYIVPQNSDGIFPPNLDSSRAVPIPSASEQKFYLYSDHRKIFYGTEEDIANGTLSLLYSRYTENKTLGNDWYETDYSKYKWPTYLLRTNISTSESYRGSPSSYDMTTTATSLIGINNSSMASSTSFPDQHCVPHNTKCTIEIDFKWTGYDGTDNDGYAVLYDNGWYINTGWAIRYKPRNRCFSLQVGSPSFSGPMFSAPCDILDNKWHTFAVTLNENKLYMHVDGTCIGHWNNYEPGRCNYNYLLLGRWIHTDVASWIGYVNNLRVTIGSALHCSRDYTVSTYFNKSLIPDKTLWFDNGSKIVKEYDAVAKKWVNTPMLPIGSIETGRNENLLTDQPTGTYANQPLKDVDHTGFLFSSQYSSGSAWSADQLFCGTIYNGSIGGYHTTSNAKNNDNWIIFTLIEPKSFERIYQCAAQYNLPYREMNMFKLYGSNTKPQSDGSGVWDILIDNTDLNNKLIFSSHAIELNAVAAGINPQWYKTFYITNTTEYKYYKLLAIKRSEFKYSWLTADDYGHIKLLMFYRNSKPEVLSRNSIMVGNSWSIGPIPARANSKYKIPIPTDNIQFSYDGYVIGVNDIYHLKRKLNHFATHNTTEHQHQGEIVYHNENNIFIHTGVRGCGYQYSGSEWGFHAQNNGSPEGNYYIKITRIE